jgi:hypothetical protein
MIAPAIQALEEGSVVELTVVGVADAFVAGLALEVVNEIDEIEDVVTGFISAKSARIGISGEIKKYQLSYSRL